MTEARYRQRQSLQPGRDSGPCLAAAWPEPCPSLSHLPLQGTSHVPPCRCHAMFQPQGVQGMGCTCRVSKNSEVMMGLPSSCVAGMGGRGSATSWSSVMPAGRPLALPPAGLGNTARVSVQVRLQGEGGRCSVAASGILSTVGLAELASM